MFVLLLTQTIRLAFRKGGGAFGTLAFYVMVVTLFVFALGPEMMRAHAAPVLCVALLLASITALPLFYERDFEDGTLEQYLLQPVMLEAMVLAKMAGQWLASVAPIMVASPLLGMMAGLDAGQLLHAMGMLALASLSIVALGSIAAALTLGSKRGGLLQALIVMPLTMPVLIFASAAGGQGAVLFLAGFACVMAPLACFTSAALIRMSQD